MKPSVPLSISTHAASDLAADGTQAAATAKASASGSGKNAASTERMSPVQRLRRMSTPSHVGSALSSLFQRGRQHSTSPPLSPEQLAVPPSRGDMRRRSHVEAFFGLAGFHGTEAKTNAEVFRHQIDTALRHFDEAIKGRRLSFGRKKSEGEESLARTAAFATLCESFEAASQAAHAPGDAALVAVVESARPGFVGRCSDMILRSTRWPPQDQLRMWEALTRHQEPIRSEPDMEVSLIRSIYDLNQDDVKAVTASPQRMQEAWMGIPGFLGKKAAVLSALDEWQALWWETDHPCSKEVILEKTFYPLCGLFHTDDPAPADKENPVHDKLKKFIESTEQALIEICEHTIATLDECSADHQYGVWQALNRRPEIATRQDIVLAWASFAHLLKNAPATDSEGMHAISSVRQLVVENLFAFEAWDKSLYKGIVSRLNESCEEHASCWTKEEAHAIALRMKRTSDEVAKAARQLADVDTRNAKLDREAKDELDRPAVW